MLRFRFGLIGHNIAYSRSHDIFKAIFRHENIKGSTSIYDVAPSDFDDRFRSEVVPNTDGLSVTIPFKKAVIDYQHEIDPIATVLEAVNSIRIKEGHLSGYNTDCYGFSLPLREYAVKLKYRRALIIGAGGAAKAAVYSLFADYEMKEFLVLGRSKEKLLQFQNSITPRIDGLSIQTAVMKELGDFVNEPFEIVVNCTPLGGWNQPDESPLPISIKLVRGKIYYDLNYNRPNKEVQAASERGMIALDGSSMLVGQALRSFYLWTGKSVPFEPIYKAVFDS